MDNKRYEKVINNLPILLLKLKNVENCDSLGEFSLGVIDVLPNINSNIKNKELNEFLLKNRDIWINISPSDNIHNSYYDDKYFTYIIGTNLLQIPINLLIGKNFRLQLNGFAFFYIENLLKTKGYPPEYSISFNLWKSF